MSRRSDRDAAARRAESASGRQHLASAASPGVQDPGIGGERARCGTHPVPRRHTSVVADWQRRGRVQESRLHSRRNRRAPVHRPSADGAAHRDGVVAERQAAPLRLDAVRCAHGRQRCAVGRHSGERRRRHQRIYRRRVRRKNSGRADDGHSRAAREEDQSSRADADQSRRRKLHRPRAHRHSHARENRLQERRPHHSDGLVRRHGGVDGHGPLQPRDHAVPRRQRAHQYAAARIAARARWRAGVDDAGADD